MSAYLEVLPRVVSALQAADFRPVQTEPTDLILDMGGTIEGMKSVPGVLDSLAAAGMSWESFRTTTYKVLAVNYQMALGVGEGLAQGMQGPQGKEFRQRIARMKRVFDQVPPENKEAFFANIGRLQGLLELGQPTATE